MSTVKVCPNCKSLSNVDNSFCSICGTGMIDTYCETNTWNNLTAEQRGELLARTIGKRSTEKQTAQVQSVSSSANTTPQKKRGGCLKFFAILFGIVFLINFISGALGLGIEGSGSSSSSSSSSQSSSGSSQDTKRYYHPEQKAVFGDLEITFSNDFHFSDYLGGSSNFSHAENGQCYAIATLTIKNTGTSTIDLDDYDFRLIYKNGGQEYSYLESWTSNSLFYHSVDRLIPLQEVTGLICFYVSEDVRDGDGSIEIRFGKNARWTSDFIYWKF